MDMNAVAAVHLEGSVPPRTHSERGADNQEEHDECYSDQCMARCVTPLECATTGRLERRPKATRGTQSLEPRQYGSQSCSATLADITSGGYITL